MSKDVAERAELLDEDYVAVGAEKNSLRARRLACPTACGVKTT